MYLIIVVTHIGSVVEMYSLTNIITMGTQLSDHMTSKLSQNDINATLSCRINVIMTSFACWKKLIHCQYNNNNNPWGTPLFFSAIFTKRGQQS